MSFLLATFYFLLKWFLRLMSLGALFLFGLSAFHEAYVYRKKKEFKAKALWISIGVAIVILLIFGLIAKVNLGGRRWWLNYIILPIIGIVIGVVYGNAQKFFKEGQKVYTKGMAWHFLLWAISLCLLQLFILANFLKVIDYIVFIVMLSTGFLVATNLMLILKAQKLRKPPPAPASPQPPTA